VIKTNAGLRSKEPSAETLIPEISGLSLLRERPEERTLVVPAVAGISPNRIEPPATAAAIGKEETRAATDLYGLVDPYDPQKPHLLELLVREAFAEEHTSELQSL
jgi:hypothetical protein